MNCHHLRTPYPNDAYRVSCIVYRERLDEGLLREVFRQLPLAHHPIDEVDRAFDAVPQIKSLGT